MSGTRWLKLSVVPLLCFVFFSTNVPIEAQTSTTKRPPKAKAFGTVSLDLNKATAEELESGLPGVGPSTAKKIVAGRPYTTVDDLAKAEISARVIEAIREHVSVGSTAPGTTRSGASEKPKTKVAPSTEDAEKELSAGRVNLNTAGAAALEALPGIGSATAKAIIDGRPWKSVEELEKIRGLGKNRISALRGLVTFGDESGSPEPAAKPTSLRTNAVKTTRSVTRAMPRLQPGQKIDINTASLEELDALPGIGPAKAQAIIAGRPFKTIEDIKTVKGIKDGEFSRIQEMITVK